MTNYKCVIISEINVEQRTGNDMKKDKRGRPKTVGKSGTPRKVSLVFSPDQFAKLEKRAKREGLTISELLRQVAA
jgi:hypothetical protein